MIGCGGSGLKTVRYVRDSVARHLERKGWESGVPKAWQFLGVDVGIQNDPSIPFLPNNDYLDLTLAFSTYQKLNAALEAKFPIDSDGFREMMGWRPNPTQLNVPLDDAAGQLRAVGRTAGILAIQDSVQKRIKFAFSQCTAGGPQLGEVSQLLGVTVPPGTPVPSPIVIVIGSMAGGTGAGIMLDVVDLVQRTDSDGAFPVLIAFTPDIFGSIQTEAMTANAAAFMSEMMSAYWDNEATDSALIPSKVAVHTRGPHRIFLIGRKNIVGLDLLDSKNVYRTVADFLAAVVTSSRHQTDFFHSSVVDSSPKASANCGGYGFQDKFLKGVASSFGSATISIGRDRFRDYLKALLHRSIIEHLSVGFRSVANSIVDDDPDSLDDRKIIDDLKSRNINKFLLDCGFTGVQIRDTFVSSEIVENRRADVSSKINEAFTSTTQQSPDVWWLLLIDRAAQIRIAEHPIFESDFEADLLRWETEILHRVLHTSTEFSALLSMPVVLALLETAKTSLMAESNSLRTESKNARELAEQIDQKARLQLVSNADDSLHLSAEPVQTAISEMSEAIVFEWTALVKQKLATALESVATTMLSNLEASISQSLSRITEMTRSQDGRAAIIDGWPKNDGTVPYSFAPSPIEFYLEGPETWPELAKTLLSKSLGDTTGLPIDPVEAARLLLIRGGFGGDGSKKVTPPLVWSTGYGPTPEWEPEQQVSITIADDFESLSHRIDSWLMRPSTELLYVLSEGLSSYLMPVHHKTGAPIGDHLQRLSLFGQRLQEALDQSRPLIEIDQAMYITVHSQRLETDLNVQGFPFGHGHPAREITESIVQNFMNTASGVDWVFSSGEVESVHISSYLRYPVHPSVITSFTQPLASALSKFSPDLLSRSFWLWRRARILENFIPLPDELRIAAIRGFAVARILGAMTVEVMGENKISTNAGVFAFPKNLLTLTDQDNLLPALLEAMILSFADVPAKGKAAFDAYGALIDHGTCGGIAAEFEITGGAARILSTGDYGNVQILDQMRANALATDPQGRVANAIKYLEANIARYDRLDALPLDPRSWRNEWGSVEPVDTMTRELIGDLRKAYVQVREAVLRFENSSKTGTGGGVS